MVLAAQSGGRKAHPYGSLIHPTGRGGVYPRRAGHGCYPKLPEEIAKFRFDLSQAVLFAFSILRERRVSDERI
jgi:hypothetical protein